MKKMKMISVMLCLCLITTAFAGCGSNSSKELTPTQAQETLGALLTKVHVMDMPLMMDISGTDLSDPGAELPEINNYPFSVSGNAAINVEIFASTEKSGPNMDGWINGVAEKFNQSGFNLNGRSVSVSIRPVASGLATDYIVTGRYIPDAFSPANELWGEMLKASGARAELVEKRIAGNTAGILMNKNTHKAFIDKNGSITLTNVLNAVMAGELLLGYTNPYVSSTGLNILTAMLAEFDPSNPLSAQAVEKLEAFQAKVPPVAYTTAQMRESAKSGILDAMIMEYQAYITEPTLSDYVFTPCGVRHDNPVYITGEVPEEKRQALKLFTDYCKESAAQNEAVRFGFNANEDYTGATLNLNGAQLFSAQQVWKEKKDAGRPVVAVFVADTSGSMDGTPLRELKTSLVNGAQYINDNNYVGLISYSNDVYVNLPIAKFDATQRAYFSGAVKNLSATGGTATYDAVLVGIDLLIKKQAEVPNAKLVLFVLSDGEQNQGYALDKITSVVQGLGIPVHTIGYNANLSELAKLSSINEASSVNADENNVVYNLRNIFNAQM